MAAALATVMVVAVVDVTAPFRVVTAPPLPIAGLVDNKAMVCVRPPLLARDDARPALLPRRSVAEPPVMV